MMREANSAVRHVAVCVCVCVCVCMGVAYVCQKAHILTPLRRRNNVEGVNMHAAAAESQAAAAAASTRTE